MQVLLQVTGLPSSPVDAAAVFCTQWLPLARERITRLSGEDRALLLALPEADHTHAEWRLAAVAMLAREAAPVRVNLVGCDDVQGVERVADYLGRAPGVTGQYLPSNFQLGR